MHDDLIAGLDEVAERGAAAQRLEAARLRALLQSPGIDPAVREEAARLVDAFRNDPYLWR